MMQRIISILMMLVCLLIFCVTAFAADNTMIWGDVGGDGEVDITDVTLIQRHLVGMMQLSEEQQKAGMVENGEELTIFDATLIQRKLVGLIDVFPVETLTPAETESAEPLLKIEANGYTFFADFEDNSSAEALKEKLQAGSVTINMHDYGNFEKVGSLPFTLPRNDTTITTEPGDVILYLGNQLTIYYDTNTWSFTRVAKIRGADSTLKNKLGNNHVTATFSLAKLI